MGRFSLDSIVTGLVGASDATDIVIDKNDNVYIVGAFNVGDANGNCVVKVEWYSMGKFRKWSNRWSKRSSFR